MQSDTMSCREKWQERAAFWGFSPALLQSCTTRMSARLETAPKHQPTECDTVGQRSPPVNLTNSCSAADALSLFYYFIYAYAENESQIK